MRAAIMLILICLWIPGLYSQTVSLIDTGTLQRALTKDLLDFQYINNPDDTIHLIYVGTLEVKGKDQKSRVRSLYFNILSKVQALGGNCFRLNSYERIDVLREATLSLKIYRADREFLDRNSVQGDQFSFHIFPASSEIVDTLFINKVQVPFSMENPYTQTLMKNQSAKIQIWRRGPVIRALHLQEYEFKKDRFFIVRSDSGKNRDIPIGSLGAYIYRDLPNMGHKIFEEIDQGLAYLIMELWN